MVSRHLICAGLVIYISGYTCPKFHTYQVKYSKSDNTRYFAFLKDAILHRTFSKSTCAVFVGVNCFYISELLVSRVILFVLFWGEKSLVLKLQL